MSALSRLCFSGLFALCLSVSTLAGPQSPFPRTLTDARGKTLTLKQAPKRIVSLIPSCTETLYALGAGKQLVGVTDADDYPPEVKSKPKVGSMLTPAIEGVLAQKPDLVVAVGSLNRKPLEALDRVKVPTFALEAPNLPQTYEAIRLLGQATGRDSQAEHLIREMQARIARVRATVAKAKTRPRVLILYQASPLYTTGPGSFIHDLIEIAGGQNIVDKPLPNSVISSEEVALRQPDVILCGKELVAQIKQIPGWARSVPAVRQNRFFLEESADATLVRPTPRLAKGIEELARFLHPELFPAPRSGKK